MSHEATSASSSELPPPETWAEAADRSYDLLTTHGYRYEDSDTSAITTGSHWIDDSDRTHQVMATPEGYVFRTLEHPTGPEGEAEASLEVAFTPYGQVREVALSEAHEYTGASREIQEAFALQQFGIAMNQAPGSPAYEQRAAQAVQEIFDTVQKFGDDALTNPMFHAEATIPSGLKRGEDVDSVRHRFDTVASMDASGTMMMYAPLYSEVQYRTDPTSGQERYVPLRSWTLVAGGMVEYQDHLSGVNYVSPDPAHLEDMAIRLQTMHERMLAERTQEQMV